MKRSATYICLFSAIASSLVNIFAAPVLYAIGVPGGGVQGGASTAKGAEQPIDLFGTTGIVNTVTSLLLFLIGAVSVIMIIIGGLRYVLSGGNSSSVAAAKNTIVYAVIGIIVALLGYAIINFVIGTFSAGGAGGAGPTNL